MEDLVLSIEQCKYLQELGLDMSDAKCCWCTQHETPKDYHYVWPVDRDCREQEDIPTYTLQEALDRLPFEISDKNTRYELFVDYPHDTVFYYNFTTHKESYSEQSESHNILDSAYNMLVRLLKTGHLKTK